tara:strand:+ start:4616 stop:6568 length:1953 start_codon:yes stop_codon:yes gene_type:complete
MAIFDNLPGVFLEMIDGNLTVFPDPASPLFFILGTSEKEPTNADGSPLSYPYTVTQGAAEVLELFGTGTLYNTFAEAQAGGANNFIVWRTGNTDDPLYKQYEGLFKAYAYMYDQNMDAVIPGGVYLDSRNVMDGDLAFSYAGNGDATSLKRDVLGRAYAKEVDGEWQFAWWWPQNTTTLASSTNGIAQTSATVNQLQLNNGAVGGYNSSTGILGLVLTGGVSDSFTPGFIANSLSLSGATAAFNTMTSKATVGNCTSKGDYWLHETTGAVFIQIGSGFADAPAALDDMEDVSGTRPTLAYSVPDNPSLLDPDDLITSESLAASDFHEVNFAYQLAEFCHRGSEVVDTRFGFIGVRDIAGTGSSGDWGSVLHESKWVGTAASLGTDGAVSVNGSGLLGNKFLSGRIQGTLTGGGDFPAFQNTADFNGESGFFLCDDTASAQRAWLDGVAKTDSNGNKVDLGKYISIMGSWINVFNNGTSYNCSAAAAYGGMVMGGSLPIASAPTNKAFTTGTLLGTVSTPKLDALAGKRVVAVQRKATGNVVTDGVTAATSASDYRRLSTMRQVEAAVDGIRTVGEPFLGEGMTGVHIAALDTGIGDFLRTMVREGQINDYRFQLIVTPQMKILGQAIVQLTLVPAFELRSITVSVGLSAT